MNDYQLYLPGAALTTTIVLIVVVLIWGLFCAYKNWRS